MRIIGGQFKGRRLNAPTSLPVRPTTDFAKEGLFNILENRLEWSDCSVLDLFAGLGGLSFEAASRGATSIVQVELNGATCQWLKNTSKALSIAQATVIRADALAWLRTTNIRFDLVLADPPYEYAHYTELIALVRERSMSPDGLFVLEHRKTTAFEGLEGFIEQRTYGEVRFSFFES